MYENNEELVIAVSLGDKTLKKYITNEQLLDYEKQNINFKELVSGWAGIIYDYLTFSYDERGNYVRK